jgi:hypothetical protein
MLDASPAPEEAEAPLMEHHLLWQGEAQGETATTLGARAVLAAAQG